MKTYRCSFRYKMRKGVNQKNVYVHVDYVLNCSSVYRKAIL